MKRTPKIATAITTLALSIGGTHVATAGDHYVFPSAGGVQLSAAPPPTFVGTVEPKASGVGTGNAFVYGLSSTARYEQPLPPPVYAYGNATPYAGRMMSHALMVAPYANYAADYARLFAPNYAVTAWTERVFGIVDSGYTSVDGWTAAAYGLPRLPGPRRRSESAPDLSLMPAFRAHPELEHGPTFQR